MFSDRTEAGRELARSLEHLRRDDVVVLALPRGGVPVAREIADALGAPLDVLVVRKIGHPQQPELGIGAVGEGGVRLVNDALLGRTGVTADQVDAIAEAEAREVDRRVATYRGGRPAVALDGKTVVVVDDGLATGFTARAAVGVARKLGAARVVVAVPVAPRESVDELAQIADEVVAAQTPPFFQSIGQYYRDFHQLDDDEVIDLLR